MMAILFPSKWWYWIKCLLSKAKPKSNCNPVEIQFHGSKQTSTNSNKGIINPDKSSNNPESESNAQEDHNPPSEQNIEDIESESDESTNQNNKPENKNHVPQPGMPVDGIEGHSSRTTQKGLNTYAPKDVPGKRGKRPGKGNSTNIQLPNLRPQLICRKLAGETTWQVIVSAGENSPIKEIHQAGKSLQISSAYECTIFDLSRELTVTCENGQNYEISISGNKPLIFKLSNNWNGEGHKISRITTGHFIAISPESWERIDNPPVESQYCSDARYRVHFFFQDQQSTDGVIGFKQCLLPLSKGIELAGQTLFDDLDQGDLFVGDVPDLKLSPDIQYGRVGEEGVNGWGQNFKPHDQTLAQVLDGREGYFYLRAYDSEIRLIDSLSFRYMRNLKAICINDKPYTKETVIGSASTGYGNTKVSFVSLNDTKITARSIEGEDSEPHTDAVIVPPKPESDHQTYDLAVSRGKYIRIKLNLPRIWWALSIDNSEPIKWADTPIELSRQNFKEYACQDANLLVRSKFTICKVGFDGDVPIHYRRNVDEREIKIPLNDFAYHRQITDNLYSYVHFNVECHNSVIPVIRIKADPIPEIVSFAASPSKILLGTESTMTWEAKNVGQCALGIEPEIGEVKANGSCVVCPDKTTKYTLTLFDSKQERKLELKSSIDITVYLTSHAIERPKARIWRDGLGWKIGKGFSQSELKNIGLTFQEAKIHKIHIDMRRRSFHQRNVNALKSFIND